MDNIDIFELLYPTYKITKPIRLIELFAGIGSQAQSLKKLQINFEHYKVVEFDKYAIASYNAIHGTNFVPTDITKIRANDLNIVNTDQYDYVLTYSFPCQDLSLAGKRKGMEKGSNTRSGLLWEVERILDECTELPQILLMENVPQVLGSANAKDFRSWQLKLEELGYSNYVSLLNAKDYGIPQNRNRCFMVSILGQYNYTFPQPQKLELRLKDVLEKEVDEKYYLPNTKIEYMLNTQFTQDKYENKILNENDISKTLCARDYKDPKCVEVKQLGNCMPTNKRENPNQGRVYDKDGLSPALTTMEGGNRQPFIMEPIICASRGRNPDDPKSRKVGLPTKQMLEIKLDGLSNTLTTVQKDNLVIENKFIIGSTQKHASISTNGIVPTLTSAMGTGGGQIPMHNYSKRIRKLTPLECWRLWGSMMKIFIKLPR